MVKRSAALISLRAYARHRGVSPEAVSKAVKGGRIKEAVVFVRGAPKISDVEIADREWEANTRPSAASPAPLPLPDDVPNYNVSRALREAAAARRENALADLAEIEVAEKLEEVVPVEEARAHILDKFTIVKTRILGVPTLVAQRLPHLAEEVVPLLTELLREVLEELAAETDGDGEEEEAPATE